LREKFKNRQIAQKQSQSCRRLRVKNGEQAYRTGALKIGEKQLIFFYHHYFFHPASLVSTP
jgi:hypothetical protein